MVQRLTVIAAAFSILALGMGSKASASPQNPLSWNTACSADLDVATCERLTWIANSLDNSETGLASVNTSTDTTTRLDYSWIGIWAINGILLVSLVASNWDKAWNWFK